MSPADLHVLANMNASKLPVGDLPGEEELLNKHLVCARHCVTYMLG